MLWILTFSSMHYIIITNKIFESEKLVRKLVIAGFKVGHDSRDTGGCKLLPYLSPKGLPALGIV